MTHLIMRNLQKACCRAAMFCLLTYSFFNGTRNLMAQAGCELPCCCPDTAICTAPEPGECPDEDDCVDKYGNPVACDPDGGGGDPPDECFDKFNNPIECPDECGCCDPSSSNFNANVALAAGCGGGDDDDDNDCDCSDNEPSVEARFTLGDSCAPGENKIIKRVPEEGTLCGTFVELSCTGVYSWNFNPGLPNGQEIGHCWYYGGENAATLTYTQNRCKIVGSTWMNRDDTANGFPYTPGTPENPPFPWDEGTLYKYDWNFMVGTNLPSGLPVTRHCLESVTKPSLETAGPYCITCPNSSGIGNVSTCEY